MSYKDIILRDPKANLHAMQPMSYEALGKQERRDLENWIINEPRILGLGADLLLITSEYDGFDKSDKRLDLLALDRTGNLVVIELKLDAAKTLADLQAIRYAAFCSTMSFKTMVGLYGKFKKLNPEVAVKEIRQHVTGTVDFSELSNTPRIILAAGGFDDQELTSCVLWLNKFGLNISCVEVTPYQMPDGGILLAPRIIIPLPETKDFMVRAELKEAEEGRLKRIFTEPELLAMAEDRGVGPLVAILRRLKALWPREFPGAAYGGSFSYWLKLHSQFDRSVLGINIAGERAKDASFGELVVWIPTKNLADAAGVEETVIRHILVEDYQASEEGKGDCVLRLQTSPKAEALVQQLEGWWASRTPGSVEI